MNIDEAELLLSLLKIRRMMMPIGISGDTLPENVTILYGTTNDGYHVHVYTHKGKLYHIKYNDLETIELNFESVNDIIFEATYHLECSNMAVIAWLEVHRGVSLLTKPYEYVTQRPYYGKIIQMSS